MQSGNQIQRGERNLYLDCLRGLAALSVMLYHFTTRYDELFGHTSKYLISLPKGCNAVMLFFILSGYFGVYAMGRTKAVKYFTGRILKMYPVYWVCIGITFILVTLFLPSRAVTAHDALINLTMAQGYLGAECVDGAYWTLKHEILFYALVGVIILVRLDKHIDKLCIAWFLMRILMNYLPEVPILVVSRRLFRHYMMGQGPGHMFMAGALIRCIETKIKMRKKNASNWILLVLLCGCMLASLVLEFRYDGEILKTLDFTMFLLLVSGAVFLHAWYPSPDEKVKKIIKPLIFIAGISYPLYLIHQNVGYIIIYYMERAGLRSEIFVLIPCAVMIAFAYLLHRFIEKPCAKLSNKLFVHVRI